MNTVHISKKRNDVIELLRFVFSITVLFFHVNKNILGQPVFGQSIQYTFFSRGSISVEFFFIISGILMAKSIDSMQQKEGQCKDLGKETVSFIWHKIKRILPCHVIAFLFVSIAYISTKCTGIASGIKLLIRAVPNLFFFNYSGIPNSAPNHIEWYICAMLLSLMIMYPLCRRYFSMFTRVISPIASFMIIGFLGYKYGSLTGVSVWTGLVYKGFLRGLAECALGVTIYQVAVSLTKINISRRCRIALTLLEVIGYIGVICFMLSNCSLQYEFYVLAVLSVCICLTFSNITYSGKLVNGNLANWLGNISLPIYLFQLTGIYLAPFIFENKFFAGIFAIVADLILAVAYVVVENKIKTHKKIAA